MMELKEALRAAGIALIEDAAQGIGAFYVVAQICFTVSGKTQWYRIYQRFCERIQSCIFHLTGGARHER